MLGVGKNKEYLLTTTSPPWADTVSPLPGDSPQSHHTPPNPQSSSATNTTAASPPLALL